MLLVYRTTSVVEMCLDLVLGLFFSIEQLFNVIGTIIVMMCLPYSPLRLCQFSINKSFHEQKLVYLAVNLKDKLTVILLRISLLGLLPHHLVEFQSTANLFILVIFAVPHL